MDGHRRKEARGGLVADDQSDHHKDNGARKSCEIAQFSGAEDKAGIKGMPPRITIGQGRDQEGERVGCHMEAVGNHGDRPEQVPPLISAAIMTKVSEIAAQARRSLHA